MLGSGHGCLRDMDKVWRDMRIKLKHGSIWWIHFFNTAVRIFLSEYSFENFYFELKKNRTTALVPLPAAVSAATTRRADTRRWRAAARCSRRWRSRSGASTCARKRPTPPPSGRGSGTRAPASLESSPRSCPVEGSGRRLNVVDTAVSVANCFPYFYNYFPSQSPPILSSASFNKFILAFLITILMTATDPST